MDLRYKQWIIIAKRDGVCDETGKEIKAGDKVLYYKPIPSLHIGGRVFCEDSKEYKRMFNHIDTAHNL
jgi:hypothetical protein